jgi:leader peptidase (prepilin peptidase) / N-methyltransferase
MIRILGTVFAGLVGLAFGSFLNVCLTRLPDGESIVHPRSMCRTCRRSLAWWENVPVLSWLALRGRCRTCKGWIGWRYPIVELAVGILWAAIIWQAANPVLDPFPFGASNTAALFTASFLTHSAQTAGSKLVFTWLLVGLAAIDAEHLWLPDVVTLPGIVLGGAVTVLHGNLSEQQAENSASLLIRSIDLAFDLLIAAGIIVLIRGLYWLIRRREGVGLGDAKLMAMLAAWLGLPGTLLAFSIGVVLGAATGMALLLTVSSRLTKSPAMTKLPLGTFLCIGGMVATLWGRQILTAYLRWARLD